MIGFCYRFQAESLLVGFLPLLGACLWLAAPATAQTTYSPWLNPTITLPHLTLTSAPTAPPHHPHQCRLGVKTGSPAWASECPELEVEQTSISGNWMSACSHKPTFVAFLDGMDSGAVLGYSPYPGRQSWNAASPPFLPRYR